jgi:hypothetical protein
MIDNEPTTPALTTYFQWFFWSALSVFLFMYGTRPLIDPDLWWHLKSGAVMIENRGLLQTDPFTFTGDGVVSAREALILKGYWLWQITAYGLYSLFSYNGIFLLNILTIGAITGVLIWQLQRRQVGPALSAFLLSAGLFLVSSTYPLERPQVISLLFIALLLAHLQEVRDGGRLGWTLPLLMILWPQFHGGYVVGVLILLCFAVGVVMEYRQDPPRLRHLLLWAALGILATFLNPNGGEVYVELFSFYNSEVMIGISEFKSTWEKFQTGSHWVAVLWGLIAIYFIGLWYSRRLYWPELIVALFLAYFSVKHARNIGLFPVAMLPLIGAHYLEGARRREWRLSTFFSSLLLTIGAVFLLWLSYSLWHVRQGSGPVKAIYPENAIEFLHDSKLQGNMFNDYTYGGYLLWRLSPQIKIFIDGRGMEPQVFTDWQKLSVASNTWVLGRREYEVLLERYAIDYIIQPIYDGEGNIQFLMKTLLSKPEWVPIYLDSTVYILARLNAGNAAAIDAYRIEKEEFKTRMLLIINYISQSAPQEIGYQVARAGMLLYMGMYDEAKAQVEVVAARSPKERSLSYLQNDLSILRTKRMIESGSR